MMSQHTAHVRQAAVGDAAPMLAVLEQAVRQFVSFGKEDLPYLLAQRRVWVAGASSGLWGFLCIIPRSSAVADLRALALINGWAVDQGVQTLLEPALDDLQRQSIRAVVCFGTTAWIVPPLQRAGFDAVDRIIYFERSSALLEPQPPGQAILRPISSGDLAKLVELDSEAFDWLWRFDRGHFMELLVTRGHSMLAEVGGRPVGYAISDVANDAGFIIRLAVHPDFREQGIGSDLLADALDYCEASGAAIVRLNTQDSNEASHRLYRRFGFRPLGRRVPVLMRGL